MLLLVSGAQCTGKTTFLTRFKDEMHRLGRPVEVFGEIARDLIKEMGLKQRDFIDFNDKAVDFNKELYRRQCRQIEMLLAKSECVTVGSDRCALDAACYLEWKKGYFANVADAELLWDRRKTICLLLRPNREHVEKMAVDHDDGVRMLSENFDDIMQLHHIFQRRLREAWGADYEANVIECDAFTTPAEVIFERLWEAWQKLSGG